MRDERGKDTKENTAFISPLSSVISPSSAPVPQQVAEKNFRRNYLLGLANGALFGFVDNAASPYLVLPVFVNALGGSNILVGLLPAISNGGWYLPQFLISHRLQPLPLKKQIYVNASFVRGICWLSMTAATLLIANANPLLLLTLFYLLYTIYNVVGGISGAVFMDIVAKTIPVHRRGTYFGRRDLVGAFLSILAGLLVNYILNPSLPLAFPINYGILFMIVAFVVIGGLGSFSLVVEPAETAPTHPVTFGEQLRAARHVLRNNHVFRRYVLTRTLLVAADLATPFYSIYAIKVLHIQPEIVGVYIGISTLASLTTNPLWSRLSDQRGHRIVMIGAATGVMLMPLVALLFGLIPPGDWLGLPFGLVFLLTGTSRTAANIAGPSYLLEIAPAGERPLYIGFTNTMLGFATLTSVLGGALLDLAGFHAVMLLTLAIAATSWWLAIGMVEPRARVLDKR